ncbi:MAG: class I SAM-dependent methyltransferase [Armatimonadota bacterium]
MDTTQMHAQNQPKVSVVNAVGDYALELTKGYAISRSFMHVCVKRFVKPHGRVLDIGAGRRPSYMQYLQRADFEYITADGNPDYSPDILMNIEQPFPIKDEAFDCVLLFNVLEHTYNHKQALAEINRILKPGGTLYLLVPFAIKIHGSPSDYYRYTNYALANLLTESGFSDIQIRSASSGLKFLSLLFNWSSKFLIGYLLYPLYFLLCALDSLIYQATKGEIQKGLPVSYFIECSKK